MVGEDTDDTAGASVSGYPSVFVESYAAVISDWESSEL